MNIKDRVREIFEKYSVNLEVADKEEDDKSSMATATLDSGQEIQTDAEAFAPGVDVYVVNDEGEKIPLPDGEYTMEDGTRFMVSEGKIAADEGEEPAEEVEAEEDKPKDKEEAEEEEKEEAEEEEEKKEEMSSLTRDEVAEMISQAIDQIRTDLTAIVDEQKKSLSAAKPLAQQQKKSQPQPLADMSGMSLRDRVKHIHNQFQN